MTQEEKAKAYDKALEYAHYLINERCKEGTDGSFHRADLQKMFLELKESEDERIRKEIILTLKRYAKYVEDGHDAPSAKDFVINETESQIAWLEKQDTEMKDVVSSMDVNSETEWDDIHKFLRMNLDGEKVKLLIIREE